MIRLQHKWVVANPEGTLFAANRDSQGGIVLLEDWLVGDISFFMDEAYAELFVEHYFEQSQGMRPRRAADFPERVVRYFAHQLLRACDDLDTIVRIDLMSPPPLAMGRHFQTIDVWQRQPRKQSS